MHVICMVNQNSTLSVLKIRGNIDPWQGWEGPSFSWNIDPLDWIFQDWNTGPCLNLSYMLLQYTALFENHELLFWSLKLLSFRFKFPAILLVYYLVSPIIIDVTFFIRVFGRNHLLCSSLDLLDSIEHSTPFCYLSGYKNIAIVSTRMFTIIIILFCFYRSSKHLHLHLIQLLVVISHCYDILESVVSYKCQGCRSQRIHQIHTWCHCHNFTSTLTTSSGHSTRNWGLRYFHFSCTSKLLLSSQCCYILLLFYTTFLYYPTYWKHIQFVYTVESSEH